MTPSPNHTPRFATTLPTGESVTVRLKPTAVSVTVDGSKVYTFDLEGRLYGAFVDGCNYRRGLDNGILAKSREGGILLNRKLVASEAVQFLTDVHERVTGIAECVREAKDAAVRPAMERIVAWDLGELAADGARFGQVYLPVSILPPDQYMALVIQATEGCPWNRCTFCDLYQDRHFRIRGSEELRRHIDDVKALLGEGLKLRKSLFLGDANALTVPWPRLSETFAILKEAFPVENGFGPGCDNVHAFTDAFAPGLRTSDELKQLSGWGLRRVTVGLETGHDPLLKLIEKQGNAGDAVEAVKRLKTNGIAVNVVVMAGLGGEQYAEAHVADTVETVDAMALGRGDIVYLSPLVAHPHLPYAKMADADLRPLSREVVAEQLGVFRSRLQRSGTGVPAVARYDIGRFVY